MDRKPSEITYKYAWFKDGQPTAYTDPVLPAGVAKKGETWKVVVTPQDPYGAGKSASAQVATLDWRSWSVCNMGNNGKIVWGKYHISPKKKI